MLQLQVYLVTGGGPEPYTASTELLVEGEAGWRLSGPLPRAVMGLRAASINNMVIATGEVIIIEKIVMTLYLPQEVRTACSGLTPCCSSPPPRRTGPRWPSWRWPGQRTQSV